MAKAMKDSGIQWIGEIPDSWGFARIGSLYTLRNTKVSDTDYPPLSVTNKGIVPQLETAAKTNAHDDRKLVKQGDFAINSRSDRRGSCGISRYDGSVSLINTILAPNSEMNPQYYDWLFHTVQFADEFYKWGHGIVDDLWTTGWQDMKRIVIPLPSLEEQEIIASFLDAECADIDALMADVQAQIETLEQYKRSVITEAVTKGLNPNVPMKDSRIEWFGYIPNDWAMIKLGFILKEISDVDHRMPSDCDDQDAVPYVMIGDLKEYSHDIDYMGCKHISYSDYSVLSRKSKPEYGDILFARYATIGTVCYVDSYNEMVVSYACLTIKPKKNVIGKYLFYYFKSASFYEETRLYINANTQGNVGKESIGRIKISLPPLDIQQAIASYLDTKCAEIDAIIDGKRQQLAVLEEYKKSVIFEYVTGKKEVPVA